MTYTIAHIVDGFGHSANIFGCNMNEYRHMTYRIHFCPRNNFTDDTPYYTCILKAGATVVDGWIRCKCIYKFAL